MTSRFTPGIPRIASSAASPLLLATTPAIAVAMSTTKAVRLKMSGAAKKDATRRANANNAPNIGAWLTSRWRWAPENIIGLLKLFSLQGIRTRQKTKWAGAKRAPHQRGQAE